MSSISIPPVGAQSQPSLLGDEELAGNALFEIAKIRINQKDFYEAFHNLQRAIHYDFKSKKFLQYKMFVEGVSYLDLFLILRTSRALNFYGRNIDV
jgi:hypothetical protein